MASYTKNIALLSLGCPKNQVDSEILLGQLKGNRLRYTADPKDADILIINTCSFVQDAIRESIDEIMGGIQWKQEKPGRKLFVMGCLPQRYPDDLAKELPEVDGFFGVGEFGEMVEALDGVKWGHLTPRSPLLGGVRCPHLTPSSDDLFLKRRLLSLPHTAYLRIADGCSQGCRYCTIPRIRGPYRSRKPDDILREAEHLVDTGAVELIVIAQETTSYGKDLDPPSGLITLLQDMSRIDPLHWIRLMYSHPPALTTDMIHELASIDKLCPYLDFPIEHASDKVLRAMGRRSTQSGLREQISLLRDAIPNIALRTSIIVGHPGEGEGEFSELVKFLDEIRFDHLGVFTFSPEEGTPSFDQVDPVLPEEAQNRRDQLMMLAEEWAEERNQSCIGNTEVVLIDDVDPISKISIGRTRYDAPEIDGTVIINGIIKPGDLAAVTITGYREHDLLAQKITDRQHNEYAFNQI
jgi:ribosomal protein S12 methylthiotransferase